MTIAFEAQPAATSVTKSPLPGQPLPAILMVCVGMALMVTLSWGKLAAVWAHGAFFDSDDAMRLVQVRDFLAGQAWHDLSVQRLAAPTPLVMHWSRIVDVPLSLLIWLFSLVVDTASAERLTRILFPLTLFAALLAAMLRLGRTYIGDGERQILAVLTALTGHLMVQFGPGRVDHHAPQILLLVCIVDHVLGGFDPARRQSSFWVGLLSAVSLAISLENLPFIIGAVAIVGSHWIWAGASTRQRMKGLALGLILGVMVLFPLTVTPSLYIQGACDAFSAAHFVAICASGAACFGLARAEAALRTVQMRAGAAAAAGISVIAVLRATYPDCLGDPLAAIDPMLRDIWLSHVLEARPLRAFMADHPELVMPVVLPALLGLPAAMAAIFLEQGVRRAQSAALLVFVLIGCATAMWQIRALSSLAPFSLLAGAWCAHRVRLAMQGDKGRLCLWAGIAAVPFCSVFWILFVTPVEKANAQAKAACLSSESFAPLDASVKGVLLGPIDVGSHVLALTHQRVVAAPYHRNNSGNRLAVDFYLAEPEAARQILVDHDIRDVLACPAMTELLDYADLAPRGMAALFVAGKSPDWLRRVAMQGPLRLYRRAD